MAGRANYYPGRLECGCPYINQSDHTRHWKECHYRLNTERDLKESDHIEDVRGMVEQQEGQEALSKKSYVEGGPIAILRYARGEHGCENEMPHVVSCDWLPDGLYPVYAAPPSTSELVEALESELERLTHDVRTPNSISQELAVLLIAVRAHRAKGS